MAMKNYRMSVIKEIESVFRAKKCGVRAFVFGKGKTSEAVTDFIKKNSDLKTFHYIVEDKYADAGLENEKLTNFLKASNPEKDLIIYGFSDYGRAAQLTKELFSPRGYRTFFIPLPFSYNETREYIDDEYYSENAERFKITRSLLEADSQALFDEYICAQRTGDISRLSTYKWPVEKQYFHKYCLPENKVSFIDAGAFVGDTLQYAFKHLDIKQYIAIEPDMKNLIDLQHTLDKFKKEGVRFNVLPKGLSFKNEKVHFNSLGSSSCVSEKGQFTVDLIMLDDVAEILERNCSVFIKMDIEGAEYNAIRGAENLIKETTPYMAVSVYHRHDDLIRIPQLIEKIRPERYEYRLGYYGNNYRELVLYTTPKL